MSVKMRACTACGHEIAANAKACPSCGAKNKQPFFKQWWFWVIVAVFVVIIASSGSESDTNNDNDSKQPVSNSNSSTVATKPATEFDGDSGITAVAEIGNNIINFPELTITVTNTTDKEIAAIKFYAVPYDVYGDEIKNWTTQSNLSTDDSIPAGSTKTISYQFIEQSVKTVKLYVYSVFFADGTEWGNKDARPTKILEDAPTIDVEVRS